jgi:murein DD-endopeptidase MepM/ murein hydrolase activator NlpD
MRIATLRRLRALFVLSGCLFAAELAVASAQALPAAVTLQPAVVEADSPVLIHVQAGRDANVEGEWLGRKIEFFPGHGGQGWFALAGVDVEGAVGPSTLRITVRTGSGARDLSREVEIHAAHYRTGALTVPPKFVEPAPEDMERIKAEEQLKAKIFAASALEPLWTASFRAPVSAAPTDSFGTRRMFNGKLASIHKGMDLRAATGTPVRAANGGVVVLARPLYYEGNCVVIDHGLGLFTLYLHLSRINVSEGQRVATADRLGLSGATGRVTGPHLHWAVRWQGAYLDPAKLLRMRLDGVRE